jgi:cytochrome P450
MPSTDTNFEQLLVTPSFVADPYPVLAQLREKYPVYWSDAIGGWLLTRYDDILISFRQTAQYSNENRLGKAVEYLPPDKRAKYKGFEDHYATKGLLHSDPPDHTRMRALVTRELTVTIVDKMRPRIQEVVDNLLDQGQRQGQMDVVPDLAAALPVAVISEIIGVPVPDRHLIREWTDHILRFQGVNKPSEEDLSRAQDALMEMRAYIQDMIAERRRRPKSDLMGKFVAAESQGQRISEAELINTCVTLFTAGHETTLSLISNAIYTLLANPEQYQLLRNDPSLLDSAIEETLRYESPVSRQTRLIKSDTELGGKKIKRGEVVFQMLNSANRDPAHFTDPERFDMRRQKNRHIAFGNGIHFCVGAALSRAESTIAVGSALKRFPNLHPVDEKPDWDVSKRNSRVLKTLVVQF